MKTIYPLQPNNTRTARPGRLPRPVVWLALLAALTVAALGATFSQTHRTKTPGTARHLSGRVLAPAA